MPSDVELELHRQLRSGQDKYCYFLLAVAASGIALSVRVTSDAVLHWSLVPLGLAVAVWGLSFFWGCRYLAYVLSTTSSNIELLKVERGEHPKAGADPQWIAATSAGIQEAMASNINKAQQFGMLQFRFLVAGGVFFVVWHVIEIILRTL